MLADVHPDGLGYGIVSRWPGGPGDDVKGLNHDVIIWAQFGAPRDFRPLRAPASVWAPYDVQDVPVAPDTPRHDSHARELLRLGVRDVVEIGGGYGGVAIQMRRQGYTGRYTIVDLPQMLYIACAVLEAEGLKVGFPGEPAADVLLVPVSARAAIAGADAVYSSNALPEMPQEVALDYRDWMGALRPRWLRLAGYHYTWLGWYKPDVPEVPIETVFPAGYREVYRARSPWSTSLRYWDFLLEREA